MGYFTFTFANWNNEKKLRYGYSGYIACPDGTFIRTKYYDGYGHFSNKDVYDLVVDWNKDNLLELLKNSNLLPVAQAFIDGKSDKEITEIFSKISRWYPQDWKRIIGITIACNDKDNANLKYPIKITSNRKCNYADLPASFSTQ